MWSGQRLYQVLLACSVLLVLEAPSFADTLPPVVINGVFDPDLADVKPASTQAIKDALAKAKPSEDGCYPPPLVTVTADVKASGDASFEASLGKARADALQQALAGLGYGQDRAKTGYATGS